MTEVVNASQLKLSGNILTEKQKNNIRQEIFKFYNTN